MTAGTLDLTSVKMSERFAASRPLRRRGGARGLRRLLVVVALVTAHNVRSRVRRDTGLHASVRDAHALARRLLRTLGLRVERHGAPPAGLSVLVANHRSYVDIPVLMASRPCVFLAKSEIAEWPVFGAAARRGHTIFVEREDRESRRASIESLRKILEQGVSVAVFPEGTTSTGPGILPFRRGVFRLAADLAVPIVPVAIRYPSERDAWVGDESFVGHFLERFAEERPSVDIAFGPPLLGESGERLTELAEAWIRPRAMPRAPRAILPAPPSAIARAV